jgi:CRISPR-associated protein Csx14
MSNNTESRICIRVDPTNPGQFFACCGLLELANLLSDEGAEACFINDKFCLTSSKSLCDLINALVETPPKALSEIENGIQVKPLIAPLQLTLCNKQGIGFILNAWMTVKINKGAVITDANPPWNFWSGNQTSLQIWSALRAELIKQLNESKETLLSENLFFERKPLSGRFGFDPGAAWNALDVGFSPNEQSMYVASSPVVELLAAVGLQRFRPQLSKDKNSFIYALWETPLPPGVACVAASGFLPPASSSFFRGQVVSRGSYAALGYSIKINNRGLKQ